MKKSFYNKNFGHKLISFLLLFVMLGGEIISIPVAKASAISAAGLDIPQQVAVDEHAVRSITLKDLLPGSTTAFADDGKIPKADKPNSVSTVYDLVVVVVDTDLDLDKNAYDGLKAQFPEYNDKLSDTAMGHRILRYAEDVRKNNDLTDVKIVYFNKKKDTVQDLASALENLFLNGDSTHKNRLSGVVLVGDIPLPVVNKSGNRYISMFPYTDFTDKAYAYNSKTKSFEQNGSVAFPKPEIWHGVIRSPSEDFAGREQLAEYLDKNHLYYEGVPMFAKFDRRMFFGDLVHEEEQINPDSYKQYLKFISSFEDLAYMRFNKFWAKQLTSQSTEALNNIPEDIKPKGDNANFLNALKDSDPLANMPDIYAKSLIEQTLVPYYQMLSKYIGSVNDYASNTARYDKSDDGRTNVDSAAGLISVKDEYTKYFLKSVNDSLEKKINELAEKIQEPISLVDYSILTGKIGDKETEYRKFPDTADLTTIKELAYRFNYKNEQDGKWYVNGIDSSVIQSPKTCAPFLGSTRSDYFNNKNIKPETLANDLSALVFDPLGVGGEYSVLTRSLRSDNVATSFELHTAGVATRMLSPISIGGKPSELYTATGGAYAGQANADGSYDTGSIVEDNPAYGVSAFIHNPLAGKDKNYKGPLEDVLQKKDVIVKVNGKNINFAYSFDQAIEESYQSVKSVLDIINNTKSPSKASEILKNFPYPIKVVPSGGQSVDSGNASAIVGYLSVDFYRGKESKKEYFSFTVNKNGVTTTTDPQGTPEAFVLFDTPTGPNFGDVATYNVGSQGAIFTLYSNKDQGYGSHAYDASAGCNSKSTSYNSDRCLGMVASIPVLDPAGSLAPVFMKIPGLGSKIKFPEKVKRVAADDKSPVENSGDPTDYTKHVDSYQFPENYKFEDVDQLYFNSCYSGLPSLINDIQDPVNTNNPYKFVLDTATKGGAVGGITPDFYGKLLNAFGNFASSPQAKQSDYVKDNPPAGGSASDFDPKTTIWAGLDKFDADEVILNSDPKVTLKDFADNYGLFDGIDNNNDGFTDYKWIDSDDDGVYDKKYYDFAEADSKSAISSEDSQQIARKLLSHDGSFTIPYSIESFPNKKAGLDKDVSLIIKANSVKTISSVILHNEPTDYTISQQMKSQTAFSLPIDNPRYVAFQTEPAKGQAYPADKNQPKNPQPPAAPINLEEILKSLEGMMNPPVYPGEIKKVKYVNLFDPAITNMAQLQVALAVKADELASVTGSYRIFGAGAKKEDYTLKQISEEILKTYLSPIINNDLDSPADGFNLEKTSNKKVFDSLNWLNMSTDEKHQYILQNYLNGDSSNQGNAYAADHTLLPAPTGSQAAFGYEAAYLLLNGNGDSFDMNFNKAAPEESGGVFDPLSQILDTNNNSSKVADNSSVGVSTVKPGEGEEGQKDPNDLFEFVWIQDFLKEMKKFINSLTTKPEFTNQCFDIETWEPGSKGKLPTVSAENVKDAPPDDGENNAANQPDPNANQVQLNTYVYHEIGGFDDILKNLEAQKNEDNALLLENLGGGSGTGGAGTGTDGDGGGVGTVDGSGTDGTQNGLQQIINNIGQEASVGSNGVKGKSKNGGGDVNNIKDETGVSGGTNGGVGANGGADGVGTGTNGANGSAGGVGSGTNGADGANGGAGGVGSGTNSANGSAGGVGTGTNGGAGTDGSVSDSGSGVGTGDAGANGAAGMNEKDYQILKSTLIQDKAAPAPTDQQEQTPISRDIKVEPPVETPVEPQKVPDTLPVDIQNSDQKWEEIFIGAKYYQKFLPKRPQSSVRRLFASLLSDNPFESAARDEASRYVVESGDSIVADNVSLMKIEATIYDSKGDIEINGTHKVKFSLSSSLVSFQGDNFVESQGGIATVYIKAGKVTGDFSIKEEVLDSKGKVDTNYQVVSKDLHLVAGEPVKIAITSESGILVANNQSKMTLSIILRDKFGNVANNSFEKIGLFVNDKATLDPKIDTDSQLIGTQLDTVDGMTSADLFAGDKTGSADVVAVIMSQELQDELLDAGDNVSGIDFKKYIGATKSFQVLDKVDLALQIFDGNSQTTNEVVADEKSIVRLGIQLLNNNKLVQEYNGPVKFTVLNTNLGDFANTPPPKLVNGELNPLNITFLSGKVTGQEEILVEIPGYVSDTFKFKVKSGKAAKIELTGSEEIIDSSSNKQVILTARLLDANNNLVEDDNDTAIEFGASTATSDLINFFPNKAVTKNGVATVKISGKNVSGTANICAKYFDANNVKSVCEQEDGLTNGTISLKINKHVTSDIIKGFSPRALYISLLGGAFGRVGEANNVANSLLYSKGQVEAISTVTATQNEKKRMFAVDGYGKIGFLTSTVYGKVVNATSSFPYQKVALADDIAGDDLANVFLVPKTDSPVLLVDDKTNIPDKEGVFVKIIDEASKDLFSQDADGVYLRNDLDTLVKVDKYGRISISDDSYKLNVPIDDDQIDVSNFAFILSKGGVNIALISFKQNFSAGVQTLEIGSQLANFTPGIYVEPVTTKNKYVYDFSYTGGSTAEPKGVYMINNEEDIDTNQSPGFGYSSLESAKKDFGLGFDGSNKHMLLFAAGNSIGASFVPYASDSGIIYGDPTIKLKVDGDLVSQATGYSKDIGKPIFSGQEPIQETIKFDANGDGYDDLLLVYESGLIRLLENEISNKRFRDRGYILNIFGGIKSISKIDLDNDAYDDLVVGTKLPCRVGEQCVSVIKNTNGNFDRTSINLALEGKQVYDMKSGDMNNDGCDDLVTSDSSGAVSIFYNKTDGKSCLGLNTNYEYSKNFGFTLNADLNEVDNLFINYPGMEVPDNGKDVANPDGSEASKSNWYKFIQFSLETTQKPVADPKEKDPKLGDPNFSSAQYAQDATDLQNTILGGNQFATMDVPNQTYLKKFDFIHIKQDKKFAVKSSKQAKDVNGGSIANGDVIEYLIALQNDSNNDIKDLMLSDATPTSMTMDQKSLKCLDAGCNDKLEWLDTGTSLRSAIIKNISIPAHGKRIISYQMKIEMTPKVHFDIGNNFVKYPKNNDDLYLDLMIRPEVNPDGIMTYLYSTGPKSYEKFEVNPANNSGDVLNDTFKNLGLPTPSDLLKLKDPKAELPPEMKASVSKLSGGQNADKDYNGCNDNWNKVLTTSQNTGDAIAKGVENILGSLRCSSGGCLPIPYNIAFLTPNSPVTGIPGFPLINITTSPYWFVPFGPSTIPTSVFRVYLSPTLTLGLGTAICGGTTSLAGICFAFSIPGGIPGSGSICKKVNAAIEKVISSAKSAVVDSVSGQSAVITDGQGTGGTKGVTMGGSFGSPDTPLSANAKVNIKIPGFPSVITNWIDGEIDEIYSKLLRFPTFYFILPDFRKIGNIGQESKLAKEKFSFGSFHDFASSLSNFPFVKLEGKEIVMKVPAISPNEIKKYKTQANIWLKKWEITKNPDGTHTFTGSEWQKFNAWNCDANENRKTICDKIMVSMQNLTGSVKKIMDLLDKISNLPKDILQFQNIQSQYATQIICYLDAIMNYTGGYIKRQQKIVESWIKTIQDVIRTFKQWKLILDVASEYQQSCDKCKSDRFSKLSLLMQLFVAIPDIPIVPLPKWPDIVVDFSQIKTGITIVWPDVVFRPEPIILPNLPDISLPEVLPDININIDLLAGLNFNANLPDLSKFSIPKLPSLPQIPLPQLPDLPRPPKIPGLPNVVGKLMINLKFIFKILCLLKNGFIPIPETTLNTEIETLTQPSVDAILPIIKNLGFQFPPIEYSYVDQIKITGKLSFSVDTNFVYVVADKGAQIWNETLKGFIDGINKITSAPYGQLINRVIQEAVDAAAKEAQKAIDDAAKATEDAVKDSVNTVQNKVKETTDKVNDKTSALPLSFDMKELNDFVATVEKQNAETPDVYRLVATQRFIDSSDPILNRSLADIKNGIKFEDLPDNSNLKQLAEIRNQMIASVDTLNSSNSVLSNIDDYNEFNKILVDNNQHIDLIAANPSLNDAGGNNISDKVSGKTIEFSFLGKDIENSIDQAAQSADLTGKRNLIAAAIDFSPENAVSGANQSPPPPAGFVIAVGNVSENVLNYTEELGGQSSIIFSDVDHDKDSDIIYSVDGDVYLKTNYKSSPSLAKGDLIVGFTKNTVSDFVNPGGNAVQGVQVPYIGTGKIDISWLPSEDAISYEVILRKSIYDEFKDAAYTFKVNVSALTDKDAPRISEKVPNGNYYVSVFAVNATANKSLPSEVTIAAPQSCADNDPPMPVINSTDYTLSIFKNLAINSSASFDPDGEIAQYYLEVLPFETNKTDPITKEKLRTTQLQKILSSDLNVAMDENGNGLPFDDKTNPTFNIGPYSEEGDIGDHKFLLHVVDDSGKDASVEFTVHVVAPVVSLDQSFATTGIATGSTLVKTAEFPFWFMRQRYIDRVIEGKLKLVPRIDKVKESITGVDGNYSISDLNLEDMIQVENADGKVIAEINPKTGNIGKLESGYEVVANGAIPPNTPSSVSIVDKNGITLGVVHLISNANADVKLYQDYEFKADTIEFLSGTNVDDLDKADNFVFENLPGNDPDNPGGAVLKNTLTNKVIASIDSAGNIVVIDKSVTLTKKQNDHTTEPLLIQINVEGKAVADVYVSLISPAIIVGPNDVPYMSPKKPSAGVLNGSKINTADTLDIASLVFDPGFKFTQEELVKRKDFVKVLLKMLCIIPRPEAHQPFAAGTGYADNSSLADYHPDIKEATLLGFVNGYKGEPDSQGLFPFKPENNISRAEAVKIILKALTYRNVIDVSSLKEGDPWYGDYMKAAQDLTPYLKDKKPLQNNFILTPEEAKDPNKLLNFEELLSMVQRVIDAYNCFEKDVNADGLTDFYAEKYNISDPDDDPDKDGLSNAVENSIGTDPLDPDTDQGGITDGKEVAAHTNPLDASDDALDDDNDGLSNYEETNIYFTDPHNPDTDGGGATDGKEVSNCTDPLNKTDDADSFKCKNKSEAGLYIVPAECNTCPCISTFTHKADLIPGDIFFSIVAKYYPQYYENKPNEKTYIFTKGNEVQAQSISQ